MGGVRTIMHPDVSTIAISSIDARLLATIDRMAREAGGVPLVLYNPPHAKTRLTPAMFAGGALIVGAVSLVVRRSPPAH